VGGRLLGQGNVADVHRVLSLLTLLAIGGHVLFLAVDQYAGFSLTELFVPFVTWYEPFWTGLGIIAAYIALAVYVSFYIRPLIGYKAWRAFHYAAFGVFALGALHGLFAGSDSGSTWALAIYGGSTLAVALMAAYRITLSRRERATAAGRLARETTAAPLPGIGSFGS
jgi:sulfoxide reductase heme-binding subunit YedZ